MLNYRCVQCAFYLGDLSCMAFEEIPESILLGDNDHSEAIEGQNGDFIYVKASDNAIEDFFKL